MRTPLVILLAAALPLACAGQVDLPGADEASLASEPPPNPLVNGGFEHAGGWSWLSTGAGGLQGTYAAHSGTHGALFLSGYGNGQPNPAGGTLVSDPFTAPAGAVQSLSWWCEAFPKDDKYSASGNTVHASVTDTSANGQVVAQGTMLCPQGHWSMGGLAVPALPGHTLVVAMSGGALLLDDVAFDATTARVTAPADGAIVHGTVTFSAAATDFLSTATVGLQLDNVTLAGGSLGSTTASVDTTLWLNGIHTLTAWASDATGQTTKATTHVDIENAPPDSGLIIDGSFETGAFGAWDHDGGVAIGGSARTGHFAASFAKPRDSGYDRLWQTVTLPAAGATTLRFAYRATCWAPQYEDIRAELLDAAGNVLATPVAGCITTGGAWKTAALDLAAWRGHAVTVRFSARLNYVGSVLAVDDVSVE